MSNTFFFVKFRPFDKVETNWTWTFDFVERIVRLVAFESVASTLLPVWTNLKPEWTARLCRRCTHVLTSAGLPQSWSSIPLSRTTPSPGHPLSAVVLPDRAGHRVWDAARPPSGRVPTRAERQRPSDAVPDGRPQRRNAAGRRTDFERTRRTVRRPVELYRPSTCQPITIAKVRPTHHYTR